MFCAHVFSQMRGRASLTGSAVSAEYALGWRHETHSEESVSDEEEVVREKAWRSNEVPPK
jgi:hypothetical protein